VSPPLLEVIVTSVEDAVEAERGGADRLELVVDLARGGMTPPVELVEAVLAHVQTPVRVMVRESESHEVGDETMRKRVTGRARVFGGLPVDGLVMGFLRDGRVDAELLSRVLGAAPGRPATFHRAFEDVADPERALEALRRQPQVDRILTGGGAGAWDERADRLARLAAQAGPGLTVIVGGGVPFSALTSIARTPALREVHLGRAVRTPPTVDGRVEAAKVRDALAALGR
jgi:copper homeostasis protein